MEPSYTALNSVSPTMIASWIHCGRARQQS